MGWKSEREVRKKEEKKKEKKKKESKKSEFNLYELFGKIFLYKNMYKYAYINVYEHTMKNILYLC